MESIEAKDSRDKSFVMDDDMIVHTLSSLGLMRLEGDMKSGHAEDRVWEWEIVGDDTALLDLSGLGLTSLPELPPSCIRLNCSHNRLKSLPELPSIVYLHCGNNQLTVLPDLPLVTDLDCGNNQLTVLPDLPCIIRLCCPDNYLTSLPDLSMVVALNCSHNQIKSLPLLPAVMYLTCYSNDLTSLPDLPLVEELEIFYNKYLHINRANSILSGEKETPDYNHHAKVIQKVYKNKVREQARAVVRDVVVAGVDRIITSYL